MSDILERVRGQVVKRSEVNPLSHVVEVEADEFSELVHELSAAADEIEQLQHDLDKCREGSAIRTRINDKQVAEIEQLQAKAGRLESYCYDYAEMTGITLNVPDEQRETFIKAVTTKGSSCKHPPNRTYTTAMGWHCELCGHSEPISQL
jgi:hypothetical protein